MVYREDETKICCAIRREREREERKRKERERVPSNRAYHKFYGFLPKYWLFWIPVSGIFPSNGQYGVSRIRNLSKNIKICISSGPLFHRGPWVAALNVQNILYPGNVNCNWWTRVYLQITFLYSFSKIFLNKTTSNR